MAEHLKKVVVLLVEPVADNFSDVRAVLAEVIPASPLKAVRNISYHVVYRRSAEQVRQRADVSHYAVHVLSVLTVE